MAASASQPPQPGTSKPTKSEEYIVRVPKDRKKRFMMLKFPPGSDVDFSKLPQGHVKMERENNFKEYKQANDVDLMPKFGAGSEFGREQKEEARRKKYGIMLKRYVPEDQPWLMKLGQGKSGKKYKGVREGTISANTSYYIFTQCGDGAFEAFPIDVWYNFTPIIKYKYLNSEEAEEEFTRRDKTLNMFAIMVKKRLRNEDIDIEDGEKTAKSKSKKDKEFFITDHDEWAELSEDDDDDDDEDRPRNSDDESKPKAKSKKDKGKNKPRRKNAKINSDDEAIEESDEGDFDDKELDYITDSDSSLSEIEDRDKKDKYVEQGVDEEKGLRKLIDSEGDSDEDDEEDNNEIEDVDGEKMKEEKTKKGSDSDSSSSSSDSESDIEKDEGITSALFMQKKSSEKKSASGTNTPRSGTPTGRSGTPTGRSGTPTIGDEDKKGLKRKMDSDATNAKKARADSPLVMFGTSGPSEGITEEAIRRYLMRKPMTTRDLFQKFKSKKMNMTNEQMSTTIAQLLKKINPETKTINKTLYISLRKPD